MASNLVKVKVKGPTQGYRSIGMFFNADEKAIEITPDQRAELKREGVLLVVDLPDDFDIQATVIAPEPTLKDAVLTLKAMHDRLGALEGVTTDLQDHVDALDDGVKVKALEARLTALEQAAPPAVPKFILDRIAALEAALKATPAPASADAAAGDPPKAKGK